MLLFIAENHHVHVGVVTDSDTQKLLDSVATSECPTKRCAAQKLDNRFNGQWIPAIQGNFRRRQAFCLRVSRTTSLMCRQWLSAAEAKPKTPHEQTNLCHYWL